MLSLHIISALITFGLLVLLVWSMATRNILWGKKIYPVFTGGSIVAVTTGCVLAILREQSLSAYCTNMGMYLVILVVSQIVFRMKFFEKQLPLVAIATQLAMFGITTIFLL